MLPSDIIGVNIFNPKEKEFHFIQGPIFNDIILVDEINRATPKTQSAFLEAMEEKQITIDGNTYRLSSNFFVIATQNPLEHYGTYPLPDSQLDRFMIKFSIGYPEPQIEKKILKRGDIKEDLEKILPITDEKEIYKIKNEIKSIMVSDKIIDYLLLLANGTRNNNNISVGLSTRALLNMIYCAKALAYFEDRDFVIPEDIKFLSKFVFSHRLGTNNSFIIEELIENFEVV